MNFGQFHPNTSWRRLLLTGSQVDVLDTRNVWCPAEVLQCTETSLSIHYIGWASQWNETLARSSSRLAPRGTQVKPDTNSAALNTPATSTEENSESKVPTVPPVQALLVSSD